MSFISRKGSDIFYSYAQNNLEINSSFHSLDGDTTARHIEMQQVSQQQIPEPIIIPMEKSRQTLYQAPQPMPQPNRLILRTNNHDYIISTKKKIPINLTNLLLGYITDHKNQRKYLIMNILLDVFIRLNILVFLALQIVYNSSFSIDFIIFVQIPRLVHGLANAKLLLMNQFRLKNRTLLKISHLFRSNFIEEIEPLEETSEPIGYNDQILNCWSILFIILPVELSFIPLHKQQPQTVPTLMLSSYIFKSIEVMIFEPILLIIFSVQFDQQTGESEYRHIIFVLILFDIAKYIILNLYLFIYGSIAIHKRNKVQV